MAESPRKPAPERPPPPVPEPDHQEQPPESLPSTPREEYHSPPPSSPREEYHTLPPSTPRDEYHTPPPSLDEAREEAPPQQEINGSAATSKSPPLSPVRLPPQHHFLPPNSPTGNGQEGAARHAPQQGRRPQLHLATGLLRTPSHGSIGKSRTPSPSPTPPSPLTPAPVAAPPTPSSKSRQGTPKRAEAWKLPASPAIAVQFDPVEEAITSPLRINKFRLDHQRTAAHTTENGTGDTAVPPDVAAVAAVGERRALSATLRVATAVLSLAAFSVMASARTSGWDGDYYGRYEQYRYAVGVNVVVCIYSIAQAFGEVRRLISPRFIFRSTSSYYFSLLLDQALAYLLMSASSAAASRRDLWVSTFGRDAFNSKINGALWLSFLGFITLAASSVISTANLFSMV